MSRRRWVRSTPVGLRGQAHVFEVGGDLSEGSGTRPRFATGACLTAPIARPRACCAGAPWPAASPSVGLRPVRSTPPDSPGEVPFSESRTRSSPSLVHSSEITSQIWGVFVFAVEYALSRAYWNGFLKLSFVSCPRRALSRDDRHGTGFVPAGEPPHGAPPEAPAGQFHHRRDGGNAGQGAWLRGRREPVSAAREPRA